MSDAPKPPAIVLRGALLGACAGAVLAGAYAAVAPLIFGALLAFTSGATGGPLDPLIGAAVFGICSGPFGFVLGILPGTLLGALAGLVIGFLLALLRDRVSPAGAAWIGLLVASVIVVVANLGMGPAMIEPQRLGFGRYMPYIFWIAGPSLLVLAGLPWVGWALRQELDLKFWRPRR